MIYRNKGSLIRIGVEHECAGRKKPVLTIRNGATSKVVASFTNEETAKEFEKTFEQFIRGCVIEDRENRRKSDEIQLLRADDCYR